MLKPREIFLIVGLSGVGKSYLINKLLSLDSSFVHFSAGSLIKKRLQVVDRDSLKALGASEILQNQYVLVDQFNEEIKSISTSNTVLFDVHTLIETKGGIIDVPFDIFDRLRPSRMFFLYANPEDISSRRAHDESRERITQPTAELAHLQGYSENTARGYSSKLDIPFERATHEKAVERILFLSSS